jgi:acyl-CoA synthetase (AMP-forming)/AMP-acid ligase II
MVICRSDGSQYEDLVYAIALARASYIPHMCPMLTHPAVIFGLMEKAESKMILYNPSLEHLMVNCPFPKMALNPIESTESPSIVHGDSVLPRSEDLPSSDIGIIFNTSGSTSGSPKIVPFTHEVINIMTRAKMWLDQESLDGRDISLGFESAFHLTGVIRMYLLQLRGHKRILIYTPIQSTSNACSPECALSSPRGGQCRKKSY